MKRVLQSRFEEKFYKVEVPVARGIYNGFGNKIFDLPPTTEVRVTGGGFDPEELGKALIELGETIQMESGNLKELKFTADVLPNVNDRGEILQLRIEYLVPTKEND